MKRNKLVLALVAVLVFSLLLATPAMAATVFVKYGKVLEHNDSWDAELVGAACVILDGSTYKMWYTGKSQDVLNISYAESTDGIIWNKHVAGVSNPVLSGGAGWELDGVAAPCVIKESTPPYYKMWYTGVDMVSLTTEIGYATSPDGKIWTKSVSNPVLTVGAGADWDANAVAFPSVINDGGTYKMWYTGQSGSGIPGEVAIGYATFDGTNWNKYASNPVLTHTSTPFDLGVGACSVIQKGWGYTMYYTGFTSGRQAKIGEATSGTGIAWVAGSTPVLDVGGSGSWDEKGVAAPSVLIVDGRAKMWYTGGNNSMDLNIGYAYEPAPASVPSSSNISTGFIIGGIAVLMAVILWGTRRFQYRRR